ncbi:uncharacterized protein BX663DRAFT_457420 [Cokeromyces recurvatus]|uniref:uncharacterized protein n=1 Tax=Cokeromyces recurvatus TaxID=90255 RepID=UPI0022202B4E|nr:uncharacterized protein BX663DRAFT_457420 [Cokeromyces recurvatus]KAI7901239.1 hypothetical protein BX663DRAFT_457420 [Cokeromyces recurvatus]
MKINISILFAFIIPFFITFSFAEKTLLKQLVDEGNQYLITGRFNEAITSFDAAIQQDSSDYILYYKRATAYLSLGKLSSAISDFTAILKLRPGFQKALLERAKIYINIGEFTLAETDLLDHKDHASDEQLKSLLASVQYAKEQYKLGQQALDNQHYDLCIQHMTEVIRISSQNSQWRLLRAQCHFEKGEIEEAIHDYTRIAHLNPSDKNILINLANLNYFSLYEPDKALNQVKQCIHYDPEDRQCKTLFRFIKRIEKEMKKADLPTLLEDSHHTNPGGFVNEIDEAFNKLKDNLNMTIRNIPKRLHLKLYTLACMAQEYKLEQVEKWCNAALKIEPNHVEILKKLGEMKLNINDFEGAVRYLERALEATEQKDRQIRHLLQRAQQLLRQSKRRDYYKILNVNRDADAKTIKKAYRKLAHEWHPDKYNGELAKEQVESKMADINQAYEVLSDPDKRQQFDNGFDPYDPEANQHPFGAQYGGDSFVRFGGGFPFNEEIEPLHHGETIEMNEASGSHLPSSRPLYRKIGQLAEGGWTSVANLVQNTTSTSRPSPHIDIDEPSNSSPDIKNDVKRTLYLLLEEPASSQSAFWTNVIVSFLIVFSAVTTTIETIPSFRSAKSNRVWFQLESAMVALFTLEYLLRMFAHSDSFRMLKKFFTSPLSIIDFISIIPFYIEVIAKRDTTYEFRFTILRLFRLLRLFKSYKYSNAVVMTIEVMMMAFRRSGDALSALFFFTVTCVVLFSTLLYFAERGIWDETLQTFVASDGTPSAFDSIPAAFWFVLVTITTTGYGDMVPTTFVGKLITFPAMMFGVLLIALPSIIVGRNFTIVWESMRRRQFSNQLAHTNPMGEEINEQQHTIHIVSPSSIQPTTTKNNNFEILPNNTNNDEEVMSQLQTLMTLTLQNQAAINKIINVLERQQLDVMNNTNNEEFLEQRLHQQNVKGKSPFIRKDINPFNDE